jgi:hypothetical protein
MTKIVSKQDQDFLKKEFILKMEKFFEVEPREAGGYRILGDVDFILGKMKRYIKTMSRYMPVEAQYCSLSKGSKVVGICFNFGKL